MIIIEVMIFFILNLGPITTLVLTGTLELWFHHSLSSWGIILAFFTLFLSMVIVLYVNPNDEAEQ